MRYEDASQMGAFQGSEPDARNDADAIPAGSHAPATGNVITGEGTQTGPSGSDAAAGAHITSVAGAGGEDSSFAGGKLGVSGEFGRLSIDAEGNYSYQAKDGTPENSRDRFTYTLADSQGGSDTATLTIEIGKTPAVIKANAQQVVPGPDGVVVLPAGVELSDIHIVGRNLVIDLPDGSQMVIIDGAVFVPQLVLGGVEVPATNLAALLIGQEIAPAAGDGPPQSSGGNFEVPVAPLDPGVPLGDLIPPTELTYTPPEVREVFDRLDEEPEIFIQPDGQPATVAAVDTVDEKGLSVRGNFEPAGSGEIADGDGTNHSDESEFTSGVIVYDSPDGVDSITITVGANELVVTDASVGDTISGQWGVLTITSVAPGEIGYEYRLADNTPGNDTHDDFLVTLVDNDGDVASATLRIDIIDDVPTARPDTDFIAAEDFGPVTGNVITDDDAGDHDVSGTDSDTDNGADTVGADDASLTNVTGFGATQATEGGWIVQGQYGVLTIHDDGSYSYLRSADSPGGVSDVFNYTLTDGDGDTSASTLTITIEDATPRLATPATAQLDDDVFTGGNPGGTDDANPDTANLSGNLGGAGGDGDLDYAFTGTNTLPAGFTVDPSSTATELKIAQNGTVVLTITLNTETGAYTVTQNAPLDHPTPGVSEEDLIFGIGVKVVDADGDSAVSTLTINVDDDTPLASNDTDTVAAGTATGNVITDAADGDAGDSDTGADSPGADGFGAITQLSGPGGTDSDATGGFTVNGQFGTLQMDASGNYTYTRNDGLGGGQNEVFTYTYRDGDGDLASATLTITIPDALPELGTPAIAQLDDETFAGGNPGGTDDANPNTANLSGSLAGSGGDGDLDYAFTGTNTLPAGFSVDASSTPTSLKIAQAGVGIVMTITLDLETGAYTVTQNQPMDHPTPGVSEEDLTFGIGVKVVDVDGDSAVNTLTIKVDDDSPLAANDTDTVSGGTATGNVITDAAAGDAGDSDTGADSPGADGFGAITQLSGPGGTDSDATGGFTAAGAFGTLQMDATGNYTYTRNDGLGGGQNEVFTYTYRDGDGDLASATLTITIPDALPQLGTPATAQTDDEIFAGGNAGGTGDASPNQSNMSGNLAGSGGDGDLDYAFTGVNTLPAGFSIDASSTASSLKIAQAGVGIVMTIDLDLETGAYTITHNQPIDHPTIGTNEEDVQFLIGVKVVDVDGDSATNTLTINADDDTPTAANDSDTIVSGGSSATGNVITDAAAGDIGDSDTGADSPGADGFGAITGISSNGTGSTDTDPSGGFTSVGSFGTLQMDASGNYTYTRAGGGAGNVSESFVYTYRDGDGDLASATLTINVQDAAPTLGTPAIAQTDDEIFAGGNAGGTGDASPNQSNMSGNLAGSGGDGDLDYAFTGVNTLPAGFSIDASSTASSLKIAQAGVGIVMTIDLDLETGAYTITHNQPIDHPTVGTNEEDVQFLIGVKVVDVDGDSATNTLTINADDDTPTAANDTDTVAAGTATGNVITDAAAGDAGDSDTGADSPGADGFGAITALSGSGGSDTDPTGGFTVNGTYGSLAMDVNGNYTYTRNDGLGGGQSEVFTYTFKDGDGDLASATLTITIPDATPLLGTPAIAQSDDEIFANGIAGGTDDADPNTANLTGNLAGSGGDGDLDYAFTGTNTLPAGFSVDPSSTATSLKIAQAGVGVVLTITLDLETGAYTVTQNQPMDHPTPGVSEEDLTFGIGVKVVDIDGDSAVNTLTIKVDDDTPTAVSAAGITSGLQNGGGDSASANLDGGAGGNSILVDNFGADGGKVIFNAASQTYLEGLHLKHGGVELTYVISNGGQTITGSAGGTTVITIELQPGGSNNYTVTMNDSIDTLVTTVFDDLNFDFVGGNGSWAGFTSGTNGDGINDLLLTPMVNGANSSTMNTNANEGGVGSGNSVSFGEGVRIDSVSDLQAVPAPVASADYGTVSNQNHVFGQHENVIGLSGLISTVNGPPGSTVDVTLTARDESGASDTNDLVGDGAIEQITVVTITHGGLTGTVLRSGGLSQDVIVDGITYHVTFQTNTATVTGIVEDTRIGAQTADGYDSLEFRNVTSPDNEFKIGAFAALSTTAGPVDLAVPISVVDGDGDTVSSGTLPIHISGSDEAPLLATQSSFSTLAADDGSSSSSLLASDSQQAQKTAANSNTTLLAAAVAASGFVGTQAAAAPGNSGEHGHQVDEQGSTSLSNFAGLAVDGGDESRPALSNETKVAANDEVQAQSSNHGNTETGQSAHGLDTAAAHVPSELSALFAAVEQGPASSAAAVGPVAPAVAMVSADALQAAAEGVDGVQHSGTVGKVLADALGHGGPPTVDGLLQAISGGGHGNGQLPAIAEVASPAADAVPAWDMGTHGAFVPGADMMFKMGAEMLHHDAIQPVANG